MLTIRLSALIKPRDDWPVQVNQLLSSKEKHDPTVAAAPKFRVPGTWLPVGVLVGSAVLAIAVLLSRPAPSMSYSPSEINVMEDAEVLALHTDPDLFTEDLAFYVWANADDRSGG